MSTRKPTTSLVASVGVSPHTSQAASQPKPASSYEALFVVPSGRGGGLRAHIRGHWLELADPSSGHGLAPTPDDLFIASIASHLAWSACHFLRDHGLPDDVSVTAHSRRLENPRSLSDISMTVTVSQTVEPMSTALEDALARRVATGSLDEPLELHLRYVG
jgi:putative redox protein